jgi:glucokinase
VRLLVLTCDVGRVVIGGGVSAVGGPLLSAVQDALRDQAAGSPFLRSMDLAARVELAPRGVPVAAIGAALLGVTRPGARV